MKYFRVLVSMGIVLSMCLAAGGQTPPKSPAEGIFCLMAGDRVDRPLTNLAQSPSWTNGAVDGYTLRTFWDKVEPQQGERDWSHFDEGVKLGHEHNKKIGLSAAAGMRTPQWVYDAGAKPFSFQWQTHFAEGERRTMVVPWDEIFLEHWGAFVRDMAARYDGDPNVAYVCLGGLGFAIEPQFVKSPGDMPAFEELGGIQAYIAGGKKIVDLYAQAFQKTPIIITVCNVTPGPEGQDAILQVAEYGMSAFPGRVGVMNHGLNAQSKPAYYPNGLIQASSAQAPVGFQMVWSTTGPSANMIKGSLEEALARAAELKGHFVEVYDSDCNDAKFHDGLLKAAAQLKQNAAALAGRG